MRYTPALFAVILILTTHPAQSAEVGYTGGEGRDPFASLLEQKKIAGGADLEETGLRSVVVQGIIVSPSNPRAIVNGKIHKIGGAVMPGIKITRIEKEGVFVMLGEKEILLNRPAQQTKGKNAQ